VTQTESADIHQQLLFGSDSYSETEAQFDELVYRAFRLIPDDFEYVAYTETFNEQEALGAYDPETFSVVAYSPILGDQPAFNRWVLAHSETHRLQFEEFGLDQIDIAALTADSRVALRAMIEGEASFVQYNYLQNGEAFTLEEQVGVTDTLNQQALSLFNDAPSFLRAQFEFAYLWGFEFIRFLFDQGGFELVDNIWVERPQSSEQVLHPELYLSGDAPLQVSVPSLTDVLDGDWQFIRQDTLGEFYLRRHLSLHLSPEELDPAALGWGGDQYVVYWNAADDELVMALRLAWDGEDDPAEFATAYTNYLRRLYEVESELQETAASAGRGKT
jgi:hypothetical protein